MFGVSHRTSHRISLNTGFHTGKGSLNSAVGGPSFTGTDVSLGVYKETVSHRSWVSPINTPYNDVIASPCPHSSFRLHVPSLESSCFKCPSPGRRVPIKVSEKLRAVPIGVRANSSENRLGRTRLAVKGVPIRNKPHALQLCFWTTLSVEVGGFCVTFIG